MPLLPEQLQQIKDQVQEIESSGTDYAELHLIYKRPFWRHINIMVGKYLTPKKSDKGGNIDEQSEN